MAALKLCMPVCTGLETCLVSPSSFEVVEVFAMGAIGTLPALQKLIAFFAALPVAAATGVASAAAAAVSLL